MISSCSFLDAGGWFVHVLRLRGRGGLKTGRPADHSGRKEWHPFLPAGQQVWASACLCLAPELLVFIDRMDIQKTQGDKAVQQPVQTVALPEPAEELSGHAQPARAAVRVRAPIPASRSSGSMAGNAASACSSCTKPSATGRKRRARQRMQNRKRQLSQRSRTPAAVWPSAMRSRFCSCGAVPCASSSMLFKSTASRGVCLRSCFMSVRLLGSPGWFVHPHERNPTQKDDFLQKTSRKVHISRYPASVSRICCASRRRF